METIKPSGSLSAAYAPISKRPPSAADAEKLTITYSSSRKDSFSVSTPGQSPKKVELPINFMCDIGCVGGKNKSCLELSKQLQSAFELYYSGPGDERGIEESMSSVVADLRASYVELGFDEAEFMPKLLEDVYDDMRIFNISAAGTASWREGCALIGQYSSHDSYGRGSVYYNADYYYRSEAMKDSIVEITRKIGARYGVAESELNLPREYPEGDIRKNYYESYNSQVNDWARDTAYVGNMLDEGMVPPRNFRFLYMGNDRGMHPFDGLEGDGSPESGFDGILRVWCEDWSFAGRVPVRMDSTRFPISVNMCGVIEKAGSSIPEALVPFLKNFDFFAMIQSGPYQQAHPRRFA